MCVTLSTLTKVDLESEGPEAGDGAGELIIFRRGAITERELEEVLAVNGLEGLRYVDLHNDDRVP